MALPNFDEIKTLDELRTFVEKAASTGSVKACWRGRKVRVGQQSVSEKEIWKKFAELERNLEITSVEDNDMNTKNIALCERALSQICPIKPNTLLDARISNKYCYKINKLKIDSLENVSDKRKAARIINFVLEFGEEFPSVFEAVKGLEPPLTEQKIQKLAEAILDEVPISPQFLSVYMCSLKCLPCLPGDDEPLSGARKFFCDEINKKLGNQFSQKMSESFPSEVRENWKKMFEYAKSYSSPYKTEEVVFPLLEVDLEQLFQMTDSLKTLFQELEVLSFFSPTVSTSDIERVYIDINLVKSFFIEQIKKNLPKREVSNTLTEEHIKHLPPELHNFARDYLIDCKNFQNKMRINPPVVKKNMWDKASECITALFKNENTKHVAVQLLRDIEPPHHKVLSRTAWYANYEHHSAFRGAGFIFDFLPPFYNKILANKEWYKQFNDDILREILLVTVIENTELKTMQEGMELARMEQATGKNRSVGDPQTEGEYRLFLRSIGQRPDTDYEKKTVNKILRFITS